MVKKLFSIRRLRIGALFAVVSLIFVGLFLIFFKEDNANNNVKIGKLRVLKNQNSKNQNVINLKDAMNPKRPSNKNNIYENSDDEKNNKSFKVHNNNVNTNEEKEQKEGVDNNNEEEENKVNEKFEEELVNENGKESGKGNKDFEIDDATLTEEELEKIISNEEEREKERDKEKAEKYGYDDSNGFDMKEYANAISKHLKNTSNKDFFKLYHFGSNYRDGDDPKGKNCPVKWKWVDDEKESDIIVMNVLDNLLDIMTIESYKYDKNRQKLLLMSMESTSNYNVMDTKKKYFDYMIDYRLDSDVPIPYSYDFFNFLKPPLPLDQKGKGGRGLAAAFISNCAAANERLEFLRELMQWTKIDSFGICANNKDIYPEDYDNSAWSTKMNTIRKYKFTIAFENSNDRDYVTEKFFQPLEAGSVPIFYGTSNIADFAPHHSYINANDFSSAKELAEYLEFLDKNDAEYEAYLEWKKNDDVGRNLKRVIEFRKINSICYLLQRIKGMWINPFLTIWDREDVPKNERACGLC